MLLSFFHTCASKQHHDLHDRESPMLSLSYTSGNFRYRTWLVYFNDGLPKNALGLREQASWMHTHQFLLLSFHSFIALVHLFHGNPYSLTLISINGHLHRPLIRLVDVRLSSPFCLLHTTSTIIFYSTYSAMSMAHAHVLCESCKNLRILKYETIAWLKTGLCMI